MTEAGMLLFATPTGNTRLSSVGRPMPGVEAAVCHISMLIDRHLFSEDMASQENLASKIIRQRPDTLLSP